MLVLPRVVCRAQAARLAREAGPAEACRRLVDAANAAGGRDNITALVLALRD